VHLARRALGRHVRLQRALGGRERRVLRCRRECHAQRHDVIAPALPRLQHHLVAARDERATEGDRRERVARVAERAQDAPRAPSLRYAASSASWAITRSCSSRASRVNAIGETPSVPTPASRYVRSRARTVSAGPHSVTVSSSSSGSDAIASSRLPSRYSVWTFSAASSNP